MKTDAIPVSENFNCLAKHEGRFFYFSDEVLPAAPKIPSTDWFAATVQKLSEEFAKIGPFYMHFGGAGDALLLLATFLDKNPDAQIVSFPNSIPAARSFFESFPSLKRIWFLPKNKNQQIHLMLRMMMRHVPNFKGMGVTPENDYFKEWHGKLDIFKTYNVSRQPAWTKNFRTCPQPKQIVLAPKGSLQGMAGSKRNIIDPKTWPELLRFILESGFHPIVIGTPDERKIYPVTEGCEDRRSYDFRAQMEHIANSVALIGADSWAKTFSALAGIPTIVFEPLKGVDWIGKKDPSDFVFIDPWKNITVVKNMEQVRDTFARIFKTDTKIKNSMPVISWEGSFLDHGSLSHVNRELTGVLKNFSEFQIHRVGNDANASPDFKKLAVEIAPTSPNDVTLTVRHSWPPNWKRPQKGKLAVIQPWEFGALPEEWVRQSRNVDEFWVPSNYVRDCYINSGVSAQKVFVVPNGVNTEKFHPQVTPMKLTTEKKFKFLFVGGTIGRKGPDLLLRAYLKNFTAADDVCLVIKDFGGKSVYTAQTFESQIRAAQSLPDAPEILYLNEELPPESLPGLYTACDCLVHPYRGEGFGLPVLEAMACGLPVIVTAGGATDDFVRDEFAWRIPAERKIFGHEVSGMKLAGAGWLLEPDLNSLSQFMRYAFENSSEAQERGKLAAIHAQKFSWKNSTTIVSERIISLASDKVTALLLHSQHAAEPAVALVGQLDEAQELFRQKNFPEAWQATMTAIAKRPFHPEAFLLLAEIALAASNVEIAKLCAQRVREMAPNLDLAKQIQRKSEIGNRKSENNALSFALPKSIGNRQPAISHSLSVCLIVKNEEKFLAQCLKSIRGLAQQVIVVDTGSTDRSVEIAKEFNAEIYSFEWCDDFAAARNAALEHATGDWILILDADEELPAEQHGKLLTDLKNPNVMALRLPLINRGQESEGRSFVPRLFRNAPGVFYSGRIHEQVFPSLLPLCKAWGLKTALGSAEILHHGYSKEILADKNKIERNLKLLRQAVRENPNDVNLVMNLGLELVRSDDIVGGVEKYQEAFRLMSAQKPNEVVPELREVLLTQFTSQLYKVGAGEEVIRVLRSPFAKNGGLTASLHFALGLAHFQLKQFSAAAEQMKQCLKKRNQPTLSPINTDILTCAPNHCLALAFAKLGDTVNAEKTFQIALTESGRTEDVKLDYAKFLAKQNHAIEALQKLNELVAANPKNVIAWRVGGEIALSKPEFLEFARDWTGEAVRFAAEDLMVTAHRAEVLMLIGDTSDASELWKRLWSSTPHPKILAALILCETVESPTTHAPADSEEKTVSRMFIEWYRKLITARAQAVIVRINEQTEKLSRALPTAAKILESAVTEAAKA